MNEAKAEGRLRFEKAPPIVLEIPKKDGQGDFSTTIAYQLAAGEARSPREVAEILVRHLKRRCDSVQRVEIGGPGFINFTMKLAVWQEMLRTIAEQGASYGRADFGHGQNVQVEFVSANPTGPLHVGHGRGAAIGDAVARLLSATGFRVVREYYVNDMGTQMENLGASTLFRYRELLGRNEPLPDDFYRGAYVVDIARSILDHEGQKYAAQADAAVLPHFIRVSHDAIMKEIRRDLDRFKIHFDVWFSETSLHTGGDVRRLLDDLKARGHTYLHEGALWFATSKFGDDKDRVLVRQSDQTTYFTSDIAYHENKFHRGFERVIDIWGADHHGYIPRMKAYLKAMGRQESALEVVLVQLVNLLRGGKPVAMAKRAGDFVTLREVIDEVGPDVARYIFLTRRADSPLDFDLDVAKAQSSENPVYYIQYAHARVASIFRQAGEKGIPEPDPRATDLSRLDLPEETELLKILARYPWMIEACVNSLEVHRITAYLQDLAAAFHPYYNKHRVITEDRELTAARLLLVRSIRSVIANALDLLGVTSPEAM